MLIVDENRLGILVSVGKNPLGIQNPASEVSKVTRQGGGPFQGIRAITLDLDDTLWLVLFVLAQAERELVEWLAPRAPLTAQTLAEPRMTQVPP